MDRVVEAILATVVVSVIWAGILGYGHLFLQAISCY